MNVGTIREIWRYPVKSMGGERLASCNVSKMGLDGDRGWALRDEASGEIRGGKQWPALMQCSAEYVDGDSQDGEARSLMAAKGTGTEAVPVPESVSVPKSVAHVRICFPDGATARSDAPDVSEVISRYLGARVTLWPLQPASDKAHYRRKQPGAAVVGMVGKSKTLRRALQAIVPYTPLNAQLRAEFGRDADEPVPNLAELPGELFEFATPPGTYFDAFPIHLLTTASLAYMQRCNPNAAWDVRRFRPNFLIETAPGFDGLFEESWQGRHIRIGEVELQCTIPTVRCGMTMQPQGDLPKDPSILRSIVRDAAQNLGTYAAVMSAGNVAVGNTVALLD